MFYVFATLIIGMFQAFRMLVIGFYFGIKLFFKACEALAHLIGHKKHGRHRL